MKINTCELKDWQLMKRQGLYFYWKLKHEAEYEIMNLGHLYKYNKKIIILSLYTKPRCVTVRTIEAT